MSNNTSQHILNTAATLLGFCLVVITSFQVGNKSETSIIDEFTSVIALLLTGSCFLSFISIKTNKDNVSRKLESAADYLFMIALSGVFIIISLIAINFID